MKDIIKSQLYQLRKDRILFVMFFLCIVLETISSLNTGEYSSYGEAIGSMPILLPQISMLFIFAAVGVICGKDFGDKTGNYEIMSGHTRWEVYMSRVILGVTVSVFGSLLICFITIGIGSVAKGWGDAISLGGVLGHVALLGFPMFRVACTAVFLTFIVRNTYLMMGAGFVYSFFLVELLGSASTVPDSFYLGTTSIIRLMDFSAFVTYSPVHPGTEIIVYDTALSIPDVLATVGVSVAAGVVCVWLGYQFFKKDDIA